MTDTTTTKIQEQLRILLQLTQTEAQIAQTRGGQARTEAVRRELTENGRNAEERARRSGEALREIGQVLFISTKTVSVHVSNVLAKLQATGRTEAVAIAQRRGLLGSAAG